ncbi:hypothetical protein B0H13DRAFT_2281026 [Mycena leptocephala]|nr:hypothetical protein B0H13DRAFT_2281026 [Mycena leptocephala]
MEVRGLSWDRCVYDGILQFQKAKGFDPYSQEVAIELGLPLLRVSCDRETLFAHRTHVELYIRWFISWFAVQQSKDNGCCSHSDRDSCADDGSKSGYEQCDSASSDLGDAFPIPEENEGPSQFSEKSVRSGYQCSPLEEVELLTPSRRFNIIMSAQLILILTATALSLYEYLDPRS